MFGYKKLYIDGTLSDAKEGLRKEVFCPATDEVIGEIAWAGAEDTKLALTSAQSAFRPWSRTSIQERADYMLQLRDLVITKQEELRLAEMYEHGKTYGQTEEGYQRVVDTLEFYSEEMKRLHGSLITDYEGDAEHKIIHQGAGVVGAFVAWNFPLLNLAFKLGPAMAAGCPLILRPSTDTPITAYMIGELCAKVGLPQGVVNILAGPVVETADIITESKIPAVLTLIGSTETGCEIMRKGSSSIKRYSMELGGNAPAIVCEDADLDLAASLICILKTANSGQICVTPNRIFVHQSVHAKFMDKLLAIVKNVKLGHGKDSSADMGPLINKRSRKRIHNWIQKAIDDGAKLLYGGKIPEEFASKGAYYMPTVLDQVPDSTRVSCDEVFGPVISISTFQDYDEVINRANSTDVGLTSYVFSENLNRVNQLARDLDFGEVQVNGVKYAIHLPHMGIKQSGIGLDCSHFALEDYLVRKRITIALR